VHYRLKYLSLMTLVLSLSFPVGVAESKTEGIVPATLTAQIGTTEQRKNEALRLFKLGIQKYQNSQFQEALKAFESALAIFTQIGYKAEEGTTLNNIGEVYRQLKHYDKALDYFQRALVITKQMENPTEEGITRNNIGEVYRQQQEYSKALDYFNQSLAIFQQIPDIVEQGTTLNNIGGIYEDLTQYNKALNYYQQSLTIFIQINNPVGKATTLNNIGEVHRKLAQYNKALNYYQQSLTIFTQINNSVGKAATLNNIGFVYKNIGKYAQALDYYQQALVIRKQINDKEGEVTTLNNIGLVYRNLAQYTEALKKFNEVLEIFSQFGIADRAGEAITLNNIGLVYDNQKKYNEALDSYQKALVIRKQINDREGEGTTLNNIGLVYKNLEQYDKALNHYEQALTLFLQVINPSKKATVLNNIGEVYLQLENYNKSFDYLQQSLAINKAIRDTASQGINLNNLGLVYSRLSKYTDAEKTLFTAIEIWESLRTRELSDDQKISIFETQTQTYRFLQQVLIPQNKINTALEISERGRARAFVELLDAKISGNTNNKQTIKPPSLEQIKQIAKIQNATLVEYSVNESNLYIWVIKPTGEITFKQVDLTTLKTPLVELVENSRFSMGAGGRGVNIVPTGEPVQKENLQTLHKILIAPIASLLPTKPEEKVIFIPHESLFLVPFVALQDKDGKYLIEKHTILTAPAIQVLELTHQQRQKVRGKDILVMGNPKMPKVGNPPVQLDPLKGAEKETLAIAKFFQDKLLKTKAITGKDATKAAFKQKLSSARIIHLATHGLLADTDKSIPTAIALAPTKNDDGLLTPAEIIDLSINAELVVLSACDTGRGAITGDGVVGLSRAFITAGAPSVIVSLWAVPDTPTAELMTEFYQQWQQNPDKAVALRNAMLNTMKKRPAPVNWAAFTLIGESK
jgi:CHAT domain-containing protein